MENIRLNEQAVALIQSYDLAQIGQGNYDVEAADIVAKLQGTKDEKVLASYVYEIIDFSFEVQLPEELCLEVAKQLIAIRHTNVCEM